MKPELALRLISEKMRWGDDDITVREFARLRMMIEYKYDHYHGFQPGSRFYIALIGWLGQFASLEEKKTAYDFLTKKLIFISQREMHHLVSLLMPIIDCELHSAVASELGISRYKTWTELAARKRIKNLLRRTLFIALSDGARIDVFRRYNEDLISNEQVVAASEISPDKWDDLKINLKKSLLKGEANDKNQMYFERFCLIDDFTGSGSSLIRRENGEWKGKLPRFVRLYADFLQDGPGKPWPVQIHHLLASYKAAAHIEQLLKEYQTEEKRFRFTTTYSYKLPPEIVIDEASEQGLVTLLKKYYDAKIQDDHTGENIWFGYRQSGLPLVLDHNTPNNSIAILWARSPPDSKCVPPMKPLFARRKRHSSHG